MEIEELIKWMQDFGYAGLFLYLSIGVFAVPIPNEIIVLTTSLASSQGILHPVSAFLTIYLGTLLALIVSYAIGRIFGARLIGILSRRPKIERALERSYKLLHTYHAPSLLFSYFIPGVRLLLPFVYGFSKLPFRLFVIFVSIGAFTWLSIAFTIGYLFGDHIDTIIAYEKRTGIVLLTIVVLFFVATIIKKKSMYKKQSNNYE